jgi:hypothetical protein
MLYVVFRNPQDCAGPNLTGFQGHNLKIQTCLAIDALLSAAALTGAAFGANTAGAGTDHLVAAAD